MQKLVYKKEIDTNIHQPTKRKVRAPGVNGFVTIPGCILDHTLHQQSLLPQEKLYYLFCYALATVNSNLGKGNSATLSAEKWAQFLGCSRSSIFVMQRKLQENGYFIIKTSTDRRGLNNRNIISPTIPDAIFEDFDKAPNRKKEGFSNYQNKLLYLNENKLFIPLPYANLKTLLSNKDLNPISKVIWLGLFASIHKSNLLDKTKHSVLISLKDLAKEYQLSVKTVAKYVAMLARHGFIERKKVAIKNEEFSTESFRQDKICWQISLINPTDNTIVSPRLTKKSPISNYQGAKSGLPINKDKEKEIEENTIKAFSSISKKEKINKKEKIPNACANGFLNKPAQANIIPFPNQKPPSMSKTSERLQELQNQILTTFGSERAKSIIQNCEIIEFADKIRISPKSKVVLNEDNRNLIRSCIHKVYGNDIRITEGAPKINKPEATIWEQIKESISNSHFGNKDYKKIVEHWFNRLVLSKESTNAALVLVCEEFYMSYIIHNHLSILEYQANKYGYDVKLKDNGLGNKDIVLNARGKSTSTTNCLDTVSKVMVNRVVGDEKSNIICNKVN